MLPMFQLQVAVGAQNQLHMSASGLALIDH